MDARLVLSIFDHGYTRASLMIKYGGKRWYLKNALLFASPESAENQAKKLAKKLGIKITNIEHE